MFGHLGPEGRVARRLDRCESRDDYIGTGVSHRKLLPPSCIQEKEHTVGMTVWLQLSCFTGR
jgi:hypothetical protein